MSQEFDDAIRIARLEVRADTMQQDIAELRAECVTHREQIGGLRRFQAWLLGGAAVLGALISQFSQLIAERLK